MGTAPTAATPGGTYVRASSGLVKTATTARIFMMSMAWSGLGTYISFFYLYANGVFPRANFLLGFVIAALLNVIFAFVWNLMSVAYPRSGGEYVYLTRMLHPIIGFPLSVAACVANIFWLAVGGYWVCTLVVAPVASVYSTVTGSTRAASLSTWIGNTHHAWAIGAISIVLSAVLLSLGTDAYFKYQYVMFWVGWVGFGVFLIAFATSSHSSFVEGVNHYGAAIGAGHNSYQAVVRAGQSAGIPTSFSLWQTLGFAAFVSALGGSAYIGGEARNPRRTQLVGGVGGIAVTSVVVVLIAVLISAVVTTDWNRYATYLYMHGSSKYPFDVSPIYMWYGFLLSSHTWVLLLIAIGFAFWSTFWIPTCLLYATRMTLAWSFDRMIPERLSRVDDRTHSPIVATVVIALIAEVLLWLYERGTIVYVAPLLLYDFTWLGVAVAAILLPYLKSTRAIFERSNVDWRVAGVPILSISGALAAVWWILAIYFNLTTDLLGANTHSMRIFLVVTLIVPILWYFGVRAVRKTGGIDITLAFKELPPE